MMTFATFGLIAALPLTAVGAQGAKLPIAQGIWVPVKTTCATATNVFVYGGGRFGSLYFYGPNQTMGPANETEALVRTSKGQNGYTTVNEGPLEVAVRPNGQASIRAFSPSQGPQWDETVRICPMAQLPAKTRAAIAKLGLTPNPPAN